MSNPHLLLLVGSAKVPSTSASLGLYILEGLAAQGWTSETLNIPHILTTQPSPAALLDAAGRADLILLSFPLYLDTMPAAVTRWMEQLAERRAQTKPPRRAALAAIVNLGFPEAEQGQTALDICRAFASEAGLDWAGGLTMGAAGTMNGKPLKRFGLTRKIVQSLDRAISELAASRSITRETENLMKQPYLPKKFYLFVAWISIMRRAIKNRVLGQLRKAVLPAMLLLLGAWTAPALETGAQAPAFTVQDGDGVKLASEAVQGSAIALFYEARETVEQNRPFKTAITSYMAGHPEVAKKTRIIPVIDCASAVWPLKGLWQSKLKENSVKEKLTIYGDWDGKMRSDYQMKREACNLLLIDAQGVVRYSKSDAMTPDDIRAALELLPALTSPQAARPRSAP